MGINPININVYLILTGYTIILNYDSSIISTNHLTLKIPQNHLKLPKDPLYLKMIEISPKPKNDQNTP